MTTTTTKPTTTAERLSDAEFLLNVSNEILDLALAALTREQRVAIEKTPTFQRAGYADLLEFQKAVDNRAESLANDVTNVEHIVEVVQEDFDEFEPGVQNQLTRAVLREMGAL